MRSRVDISHRGFPSSGGRSPRQGCERVCSLRWIFSLCVRLVFARNSVL
jgi:hypothetical protein